MKGHIINKNAAFDSCWLWL